MKAIILAAGRSTRLYPLTLNKPKCLLDLGGTTIIEHQIKILHQCGVEETVVIVGYLADKIKEVVGANARYVEFKDFAKTNNLHTLWHAREELNDDIICLFADVVIGKETLQRCIDDDNDFSLLVHTSEILPNTMRVKIKNNSIYDIGSHIPVSEGGGNFVGIAKYSKKGAGLLKEQMAILAQDNSHINSYYTACLPFLANKGYRIGYQDLRNDPWIEVDFAEDYERAKKFIYPLLKHGPIVKNHPS